MVERGLYYATANFAQMIKNNGGTWNDTKHRPIVCLIKSKEHGALYWAIPMGKLNHRNDSEQKRLDFYLNLPEPLSIPPKSRDKNGIISSANFSFLSLISNFPIHC